MDWSTPRPPKLVRSMNVGTNTRICFLNVTPDEVIRSLFYNKSNNSIITVSVYRYAPTRGHLPFMLSQRRRTPTLLGLWHSDDSAERTRLPFPLHAGMTTSARSTAARRRSSTSGGSSLPADSPSSRRSRSGTQVLRSLHVGSGRAQTGRGSHDVRTRHVYWGRLFSRLCTTGGPALSSSTT